MAAVIGLLDIEYFQRPDGVLEEFTEFLASHANRISKSCAFGFYLRQDMEHARKEFCSQKGLNSVEAQIIDHWIEYLPWRKDRYLGLVFNQ
jgi:hypothetical protein